MLSLVSASVEALFFFFGYHTIVGVHRVWPKLCPLNMNNVNVKSAAVVLPESLQLEGKLSQLKVSQVNMAKVEIKVPWVNKLDQALVTSLVWALLRSSLRRSKAQIQSFQFRIGDFWTGSFEFHHLNIKELEACATQLEANAGLLEFFELTARPSIRWRRASTMHPPQRQHMLHRVLITNKSLGIG